jgi:S-adenosylmethionine/arginine decarboxylase-like enzyme
MKGLPLRFNLMLNGYVAPEGRNLMNTEHGIAQFLKMVAMWADMDVVTTQTINLEDPVDGEWYGLTGLAMIKTSHIAFHIWPHYDSYYFFDISSCKPFDPNKLREEIELYLGQPCEWQQSLSHTPVNYKAP